MAISAKWLPWSKWRKLFTCRWLSTHTICGHCANTITWGSLQSVLKTICFTCMFRADLPSWKSSETQTNAYHFDGNGHVLDRTYQNSFENYISPPILRGVVYIMHHSGCLALVPKVVWSSAAITSYEKLGVSISYLRVSLNDLCPFRATKMTLSANTYSYLLK